jgi:Zn-dependent protease
MSLAGPATNFLIAILAGLALKIGLLTGTFGNAAAGSLTDGVSVVLSTFFTLNLLLGIFNLLPFPPLDGYGALSLFTSEEGARKLIEWRFKFRGFAILGLILGWRIVDRIYEPALQFGINLIKAGV